ncbi:MAG TPA: cation acetate symporter, partial [Arachnia sp.]|nr:cation acetate symporter [Arachnia sp.]
IGLIAIVGGIAANGQNIAFLVALAFAVAASANLPSILYSLYWKRFSTAGAVWSIFGGLISAVGLIIFSPAVSGNKGAMFPDLNFAWFPIDSPAIVSVPIGFFLGWLGSVLKPDGDTYADQGAEMEVRSMTGAGAEGALDH